MTCRKKYVQAEAPACLLVVRASACLLRDPLCVETAQGRAAPRAHRGQAPAAPLAGREGGGGGGGGGSMGPSARGSTYRFVHADYADYADCVNASVLTCCIGASFFVLIRQGERGGTSLHA
jgi:hypothetical protein